MDIVIRKAHTIDVGSIFVIMEIAAEQMKNSGLFLSDNIDYINSHIEKNGITFIAEINGITAGFLAVDIPGELSHNLGFDIGLPLSELSLVAHMDSIVVLPDFRGLGLQKALLKYAEEQAHNLGYTHFMATVHPDNAPSLKSFLASGYEIKITKLKYNGLIRHVLYKNIETLTKKETFK